MTQKLDPIVKKTRAAARAALERVGREAVAELVRMVSVPVVRGRYRIIRSLPGEPPRKEFGTYVTTIKHKRMPGGHSVEELSIYSNDPRALWFEKGTSRMAKRPHFAVIQKKFGLRMRFKQYLAEEMRKR
jgi:hypothetical protein